MALNDDDNDDDDYRPDGVFRVFKKIMSEVFSMNTRDYVRQAFRACLNND